MGLVVEIVPQVSEVALDKFFVFKHFDYVDHTQCQCVFLHTALSHQVQHDYILVLVDQLLYVLFENIESELFRS